MLTKLLLSSKSLSWKSVKQVRFRMIIEGKIQLKTDYNLLKQFKLPANHLQTFCFWAVLTVSVLNQQKKFHIYMNQFQFNCYLLKCSFLIKGSWVLSLNIFHFFIFRPTDLKHVSFGLDLVLLTLKIWIFKKKICSLSGFLWLRPHQAGLRERNRSGMRGSPPRSLWSSCRSGSGGVSAHQACFYLPLPPPTSEHQQRPWELVCEAWRGPALRQINLFNSVAPTLQTLQLKTKKQVRWKHLEVAHLERSSTPQLQVELWGRHLQVKHPLV